MCSFRMTECAVCNVDNVCIGESEGPRAGGERGAPHDGGQGLQAEGQTPPLRARDQHC